MSQDPLFLLRDYVTNDRLAEVVEDGEDIVFGGRFRVPKETKTAYKDRSQDMFISILSAVILAKNPVRYKYISEMNKRKQAKLIGTSEMKDLVDFLSGLTEDSVAGNIEHSSVSGSRAAFSRSAERASKRPRKTSENHENARAPRRGDVSDTLATKYARSVTGESAGATRAGGIGATTDAPQEGSDAAGRRAAKIKSTHLHEVVMRDRNTSLRTPNQDYSFALGIYKAAHAKSTATVGTVAAGAARTNAARNESGRKAHQIASSSMWQATIDHRLPIIIVPASSSALLTLLNVSAFLGNGTFVDSGSLAAKGEIKPAKVVISRKLGTYSIGSGTSGAQTKAASGKTGHGRSAEYLVIDNPSRLQSSDWERVVAVVALGKDWQFKGWRWNSPVDLFSHAMGVYVKWDNESTPLAVAKWNVKILDLSKNRRHLDATAAIQFWQHLDNFVKVFKPQFERG